MSPGKNFLVAVFVVFVLMLVIAVAARVLLKDTTIVLAFEDAAAANPQTIEATLKTLDERVKAFGVDCNIRSGKVEYRPPHFVATLRGYADFSFFSNVFLKKDEARLHLSADPEAIDEAEKTGVVPEGFQRHVIVHEFLRMGANYEDTAKEEEPILLQPQPLLVLRNLKEIHFQLDGIDRRPIITIEFNEADGKAFARLTEEHKGKRLALVIDDEVYSAPTIEAEVTGGVVQIRNIVNMERARRLYNILRIGTLPAPLKVVRIDPPGQQPDPAAE
ncbi:MAG TPA: hypothetical protein VM141_12135 [Planctomycetota bacterium]|nr:hypothetical protein [Planctomycetota bacterium]